MKKVQYSIGEIAKKVGIHDQTIRTYERVGLLHPRRNEHNIRRFNDADLKRIILIITLTQEMGMNFPGVRLVLELARRLYMQPDELLDFIEDHRG
ncbi:MAG: MerR family transcriptional regulator [Candidatus Cloacimonetes bacterium]|nr:MerR family transcriptional regulator [Candidatus Cloacimonadota bacterium]